MIAVRPPGRANPVFAGGGQRAMPWRPSGGGLMHVRDLAPGSPSVGLLMIRRALMAAHKRAFRA